MPVRRPIYAFGLALAFALGAVASPLSAIAQTARPELAAFWKAWDLAHDKFVYRDALVPEKMVQGAIRGMIDALGDDGHTRYLSPADVKLERSSQRGRYDGIGAEVNIRGGRPIIVAPIEGSPAEKAGLRAGDAVIAVDGEDVADFSLSELVDKVRGPRGSTVVLTVVRPNESTGIDVPIQRGEIRVSAVTWAMVPGVPVAHVRMNRFAANTTEELKKAIEGARAEGAEALVLDLRNNPGGLLNQAVSSVSQFLSEGDVLLEENADGERKSFPVQAGGVATEMPMVVVINKGSASASEIFAGAMQDYGRAKIVGEKSFGTGTVLSPQDLPDGSQIYLGVAQWLTPKGRVIRKVGIKPDVNVVPVGDGQPLSPREERLMTVAGFLARNDVQLLKAVDVLGYRPMAAMETAPAV